MTAGRVLLALALVVLIGIPIALAPRGDRADGPADRLVIITPHNEKIRQEFGDAFRRWHLATYGTAVEVQWSTPGGTSDIRKMLESSYAADLRRAASGEDAGRIGGGADLLWGGGSFEFNQLAKELAVRRADGQTVTTTVLAPLPLDAAWLASVYGPPLDGEPPVIGDAPLYDKNGRWYGTALSGFGIVFNRDRLAELGVPEPTTWADLGDPRLRDGVALVNPAQSGSVTTAYEAILQRRGWTEGWRILRRMAANARTFSPSAPKAPTDVSVGDAVAGVCIDFYGRYQAQSIRDGGDSGERVGYVDPPGQTVIDPDPIALLRGAPHPELAQRFVEFVLSREGQTLWQFPARAHTPRADGLGPDRYELRRMPIRRDLYAGDDFLAFVDRVDPWSVATRVERPDRTMRSLLPSLFVAMAIDNRAGLREAWGAIVDHPAYPPDARSSGRIVTAADVDDPTLREMLDRFDALPTLAGPGGATYPLAETASLQPIRDGWLRDGWSEAGLWPEGARGSDAFRSAATAFFRDQYERIVALGRGDRS